VSMVAVSTRSGADTGDTIAFGEFAFPFFGDFDATCAVCHRSSARSVDDN